MNINRRRYDCLKEAERVSIIDKRIKNHRDFLLNDNTFYPNYFQILKDFLKHLDEKLSIEETDSWIKNYVKKCHASLVEEYTKKADEVSGPITLYNGVIGDVTDDGFLILDKADNSVLICYYPYYPYVDNGYWGWDISKRMDELKKSGIDLDKMLASYTMGGWRNPTIKEYHTIPYLEYGWSCEEVDENYAYDYDKHLKSAVKTLKTENNWTYIVTRVYL